MTILPQYYCKHAGYTLVEMAIVVALLGVLAGTILSIASQGKEREAIIETEAAMDEVERALQTYFNRYDRVPCPASPTLTRSDPNYGIEANCSLADAGAGFPDIAEINNGTADEIWVGAVPVRTLGLPDRYMRDYWNSRLSYNVHKDFADVTSDFTLMTATDPALMMQVHDMHGAVANPVTVENPVVYVLLSHGSDKEGAYSAQGTQRPCNASTMDSQNCDMVSGSPNNIFLDTTRNDSDFASERFYDLVRHKTKANFGWNLYAQDPLDVQVNTAVALEEVTCILTNTRVILCSGDDSAGMLGDGGIAANNSNFVREANGSSDWIILQGGASSLCAIRATGEPYCWGLNDRGQLGNGTAANATQPIRLSTTGDRWSDIDVGRNHGCGINDGMVYCWGNNTNGQLGTNNTSNYYTPVRSTNLHNDWESISVGNSFTCGVRSADGMLYCTGDVPGGGVSDEFVQIGTATGWSYVHAGVDNACAIRSGALYCWGDDNSDGQLGSAVAAPVAVPTLVTGSVRNWKQAWIYAGNACGVTRNGDAYCWGDNSAQQLGVSAPAQSDVPIEVTGAHDSAAITIADEHACSVSLTMRLHCWGINRGKWGNGLSDTSPQAPVLIPDIMVTVP